MAADLLTITGGSRLPPLLEQRFVGEPLCLSFDMVQSVLRGTPSAQMGGEGLRRAFNYAVIEGVAVVPVFGILMKRGTGMDWLDEWLGIASVDTLRETLAAAMIDPTVQSILFQIDSPGGEVGGIFDFADVVYAQRGVKPMVAHADESAYSAAYLLASAADRVVLPRTGGVGSIGVIACRLDATGWDAQMGLVYHVITSGKRKADFNPDVKASAEELAVIQREVDRVAGIFFESVSRNRGLSVAAIRAMEAGIFRGSDGVAAGLADAVGTFEETLMELATQPATSLLPLRSARMATETKDPTQAAAPKAEVINLADHQTKVNAARAEAAAEVSAYAEQVFTICTLAGVPAKAVEYINAKTPIAEVSAAMIAHKAKVEMAKAPEEIAGTQSEEAIKILTPLPREQVLANRKKIMAAAPGAQLSA